MAEVCVMGHITIDHIFTGISEAKTWGGVGYYTSIALKKLGCDVHLITRVAERDREVLAILSKNGIKVTNNLSKLTTTFENIYSEGFKDRTQRVLNVADSFGMEDIENINAKMFHLGPLFRNDIPKDVILHLSKVGRVSLDVQGCLREMKNGVIQLAEWAEQDEVLSYVTILKADEREAFFMTKEEDLSKATEKLSNLGVKEIIITCGEKGSVIRSGSALYHIPAFTPKKFGDVTGAGDTYMAGYLFSRLDGKKIPGAGTFAAAVASLKIENLGPFSGNKKDVGDFLRRGGFLHKEEGSHS